MTLKHFQVSAPDTIEDSSWVIYAETPEMAAELYVRAVLDEEISVDPEDMEDCGKLEIECFPAPLTSPGIVDWAQVTKLKMDLSSVSAWLNHINAEQDPSQDL